MTIISEPVPTEAEAKLFIEQLVQYARQKLDLNPLDVSDTRNRLLDLFQFTEPVDVQDPPAPEQVQSILDPLIHYGHSIGLIPEQTVNYRDLLDAKIMGLLLPKPSQVVAAFEAAAASEGLQAATDRFYQLNINSNYIRMDRIAKNQIWLHSTDYGKLEITINLSKPEKDPKEIALLRTMQQVHYPKCPLCTDNVGYAGRLDHPARQNLRIIPLQLQNEDWFFQYSPYVYYNEHSIVFKAKHEPMVISHSSFARLLDFVESFPHYFIGSNADLPIVGGSILSHDHFQAGRHQFPMEVAPEEASFTHPQFADVSCGIVNWPMSVLRTRGASKASVHSAACYILDQWRQYSDSEAEVLAFSKDGTPHNTITPIARLTADGKFEIDLVLRNNRTSEEHPDGIFHPHKEHHHIKKENIGLIEVMGLAVLPGRLKQELEELSIYLTDQAPAAGIQKGSSLEHHAAWLEELRSKHGASHIVSEARQLLLSETGDKFLEVLKDAGVFKRTSDGQRSFRSFLYHIGMQDA